MKKTLIVLMAFLLMIVPLALGIDTRQGIGINYTLDDWGLFAWYCGGRAVLDDNLEWWRVSDPGEFLEERRQNYLFEGESISGLVLVKDKLKPEALDVAMGLGLDQDIIDPEVNCQRIGDCSELFDEEVRVISPSTSAELTADFGELYGSVSNTTFNVTVDGVTYNLTFPPSPAFDDPTALTIATYINNQVGFTLAYDVGGFVTLRSPTTGTGSTLRINPATANSRLGFTNGESAQGTNEVTQIFPVDNYDDCNARIDEEVLDCDIDPTTSGIQPDPTQQVWACTMTVESPASMSCENWLNVVVTNSVTDMEVTLDEAEFWFFNPVIGIGIDGELDFGDVRPGTSAYSDTVLVQNIAQPADSPCNETEFSGVMLDMFITGTDFYDPFSTAAACPTSNVLRLSNFAYFATNGAYSTLTDPRADAEGYVPIDYGTTFSRSFYDNSEIIQQPTPLPTGSYSGNILSPGSEIALTFRLNVPEPCYGEFTSGDIFFWAEAI